jgi:hypothetical protein
MKMECARQHSNADEEEVRYIKSRSGRRGQSVAHEPRTAVIQWGAATPAESRHYGRVMS